MNKKAILKLNLILLSCVLLSFVSIAPNKVSAVSTNHIVISEVQLAGITSDDEFVELYNPTNSSVDLTGWRLNRKTSTGTESILVSNLSISIPAHGFLLITPPTGYTGSTTTDKIYSNSSNRLTANNAILLYSDAGTTLVDKIGMGTANEFETSTTTSPATSQSIERKAKNTSTISSMTTGTDINQGNSEDSDNNLNDFIVRDSSNPQNSLSTIETLQLATPTPSATPVSTPTPSPTPSATPSPTPVVTPTPSPSVVPSAIPSPTPSPLVTPTVSSTPSATPKPNKGDHHKRWHFEYRWEHHEVKIKKHKIKISKLICRWVFR